MKDRERKDYINPNASRWHGSISLNLLRHQILTCYEAKIDQGSIL